MHLPPLSYASRPKPTQGPRLSLPSMHFAGATQPQPPQPRYGLRQLRNALALGVALTGALASQFQSTRMLFPGVAAAITGESVTETPSPKIISWNNALGVYLQLMAIALARMSLTRRHSILFKTLKPSEMFQPLHEQGITGEGIKIGVVDMGFQPGRSKFSHQWDQTLDTPSAPEERKAIAELNDCIVHGTHVSNIIADALPASRIITACTYTKNEFHSDHDGGDSDAFITANLRNPKSADIVSLLQSQAKKFKNWSNRIDQCIEQGADVVNVSLGCAMDDLQTQIRSIYGRIEELESPNSYDGEYMAASLNYSTRDNRLFHYHLKHLKEQMLVLERELRTKTLPQEAVDTLLQPWTKVLDKAAARNIPIILAAGNTGPRSRQYEPGSIGSVSLMAWNDHPALFVAGSSNLDGGVNIFSAEGDSIRQPLVSTIGGGEMETQVPEPFMDKIRRRFEYSDLLFPARFLVNTLLASFQPDGTSFSAPMLSAAIGAMKQAAPGITLAQLREALRSTASEVHLSAPLKRHVDKRNMEKALLTMVEPLLRERLVCYRAGTWRQPILGLETHQMDARDLEILKESLTRTKLFTSIRTESQSPEAYTFLMLTLATPLKTEGQPEREDELKLAIASAFLKTRVGQAALDPEIIQQQIEADLPNALRRFSGAGQLNLYAAVQKAKELHPSSLER